MSRELDPERWRRAQEVLDAVVERPAEAREAYLADACGDDASLAEQVRSLLAQESEGFLARPAAAMYGLLETGPLSETPSLSAGARIGPYRVLRELGRGGMGVVWEAEQEQPVHRHVALKLIQWGMDTKQVVARFESERQALALMNHRNIAGVYDAGATEQGRPYFAMEYVPGGAITEYCDSYRLSLRDRLELFSQVCQGVQHAHQKGVIHRDLKPANILVTLQEGPAVPKIIDFGVAKATAQRLTEKTLSTELGQMIGTPAYMSPEQADLTNPDIDTRTDVYSLGALLYELLVGVPPVEAKAYREAGFDALLRAIRDEDPPVPSARLAGLGDAAPEAASRRSTDVSSLGRALRGDLDWIVMKALSKDRRRRYATAQELADDISRHLNDEPVLAGPPETGYRLRKFFRRHRVGVLAGTLVAAAVLVAAIGTSVGFVRAREAERLAREAEHAATEEAAKATAINEFLQGVLGAAHPELGIGRETTVLEALAAGVERVDESFEGQPEIEAAVRYTIGATYNSLARFDDAEVQLRRALDLRRGIHGEFHLGVVDALDELGTLYYSTGEPEKSAVFHRAALGILRRLPSQEDHRVVVCLSNLGAALSVTGDFEQAAGVLREAIAIGRRAGRREPETVTHLSNLAAIVGHLGQADEAERLFREAVRLARSLPSGRHPGLGSALNNWGRLLERERRQSERAEPLYREAIDVYQRALGEGHWQISHVRGNLGECLMRLGRWDEAEWELVAAIEGMEAAFGPDDDRTEKQRQRLEQLRARSGPERQVQP